MPYNYETHPECRLTKSRVVCTYPHALVHGLLWYASLDIPNLYTEQLVIQLSMLLCMGDQEDDTMGLLVQASGSTAT